MESKMTNLEKAAQQVLEVWDVRAGINTASIAFEALRTALIEHQDLENLTLTQITAKHPQKPEAIVIDPYDTPGLQWLCQHPPELGTKLYTTLPQPRKRLTDEER
jgi:hypothetical protein